MSEHFPQEFNDNLIFRNISIDRIDGIRDGYVIETLSPGINLIHGPNGIGKSRTALALHSLIWPSLSSHRTSLIGNFELSGDSWNLQLEMGKATYQKNSAAVSNFSHNIPPQSHHDRYLLTLQDLLRVENKNFAREIQKEASGGYDLDQVRSELKIPAAKRGFRPSKSAKSLQEARERLRSLRHQEAGLRDQEASLNRLNAEHAHAIAASNRLVELNAARTFRAASEQLQAANIGLDSFPAQLDRMHGTEYTQAETLIQQIGKLREEHRLCEIKISSLQDEINSTGYSEKSEFSSVTTSLRNRLGDLQRQEEQMQLLESSIQEHTNHIALLRNRLQQGLTEEQMESLDETGLRALAELSREWHAANSTLHAQNELAQWLGSTPDWDRESIRTGIELLSRHLRTQTPDATGSRPRLVVIFLVAAAIVIMVEAMLLFSSLSQPAILLALSAVPLLWLAFMMKSDSTEIELKHIQSQYAALSLIQPEKWTEKDVFLSFLELQRTSAQAELDSQRQIRWANLEDDREKAESQLRSINERSKLFTESFGVELKETVPESLEILAQSLENRRRETDQLHRAVSGKQALELTRTSILSRIKEELHSYGLNIRIDDAISAQAGIEELAERMTKAQGASAALDNTRQKRDKDIVPRIRELEKQLESIYTELDLEVNDLRTLRNFNEQVDAYKEARNIVNTAEVAVSISRSHLRQNSDDEFLDHDAITTAITEMTRLADRRDALQADISRVTTEINRAQHQTNFEQEVANEHVALEALAEGRDQDYVSATDRLLFEFVQTRNRDVNRPPVFRTANELFISFTNGAYHLGLDEESDEFTALEADTGRAVMLDNLSSGTRVQLLLAVRLAFIKESEQGVQLPLILDETLGNTDDVRAEAIIDATIEIAVRGRQVFYFTAQHDEIGKWSSALKALETPLEWVVHDLASIRGKTSETPATVYSWDHSASIHIEISNDTDHEALFDLLDVPTIDIRSTNILEVDLWYTISDVSKLVELRNRGIRQWGQYLNLHSGGHLRGVWSEPVHKSAMARAQAIEALLRAWRVGRPAPITADDLGESNKISDSFWGEVLQCAQKHNWEGSALIRALERGEVRNFRRATIIELSEWLGDNGFITDIAPLDDVMIRARALSSMNEAIENNNISTGEIDELLGEVFR